MKEVKDGDLEYFFKNHFRVFGYMIYAKDNLFFNARSAMGRYFPPLTLTREEIDELTKTHP